MLDFIPRCTAACGHLRIPCTVGSRKRAGLEMRTQLVRLAGESVARYAGGGLVGFVLWRALGGRPDPLAWNVGGLTITVVWLGYLSWRDRGSMWRWGKTRSSSPWTQQHYTCVCYFPSARRYSYGLSTETFRGSYRPMATSGGCRVAVRDGPP